MHESTTATSPGPAPVNQVTAAIVSSKRGDSTARKPKRWPVSASPSAIRPRCKRAKLRPTAETRPLAMIILHLNRPDSRARPLR
jgi:hypothetical protein